MKAVSAVVREMGGLTFTADGELVRGGEVEAVGCGWRGEWRRRRRREGVVSGREDKT